MADGWIELFDAETDEAEVLFVSDRFEPVDYGCGVFALVEVVFFRDCAVDAVEDLFANFAYLDRDSKNWNLRSFLFLTAWCNYLLVCRDGPLSSKHPVEQASNDAAAPYWLGAAQLEAGGSHPLDATLKDLARFGSRINSIIV